MKNLKVFSELCKFKVSLLSALSAATGFILSSDRFSWNIFTLFFGIFLLASGACALNQYQERDTDLLMERTRQRPLPSRKIKPKNALLFSIIFISWGLLLLLPYIKAFFLALFIFFWYNFVYTPLKRKVYFVTLPGSLAGALTPATGWLAGGGSIFDFQILIIIFFFFIWQIPHFWLNLLYYGKDCERAGLPSITSLFTEKQLVRITFIWILAAGVTCLLIPLYIVNTYLINSLLFLSAAWLIWKALKFLGNKEEQCFFTFKYLNIYALLVISLLSLDKLLFFSYF